MKRLIAGNWKMNGSLAALGELDAIADAAHAAPDVDIAVFPPFTLVGAAAMRGRVAVGGQDCHGRASGAHTGCVSAAMLREADATMVIVGHSERRTDQRESDAEVRDKASAALAAGLTVILCVGESEADRDAGRAIEIVAAQLAGSIPDGAHDDGLVIAYEPIWAIGTGRTPTTAEIAEMHALIRGVVGQGVRILYGGSVKPTNAAEILAVRDVDGALVGGASLTAAEFVPIIAAAQAVEERGSGR